MRIGIITIHGEAIVDGTGEYLGALDDTTGLLSPYPTHAFLRASDLEYITLIQWLLPRGWAWSRSPASNLFRCVSAIAKGFARLHRRIVEFLVREADPRTASDMLPDWERAFGLPDECVATDDVTLEQRRRFLVAAITSKGGQSIPFLTALAGGGGYTVTISEHRMLTCIDPCDGIVYAEDWQHAFTMHAPSVSIYVATCEDICTVPLRTWGNDRLECLIRRAAPAHTIPIFAYAD